MLKVTASGPQSISRNKTQYNTPSPFSSIIPDHESSDEDDGFINSLTSHPTANDSTETKSYFLPGKSLKPNQVQDISIPTSTPESVSESQFSSRVPYLESTDQTTFTDNSVLYLLAMIPKMKK